MNNLGLYTSYDKIERVDTVLEQLTIHMAGSHRVPVTPSVVPHELVHGAMEKFDLKGNTISGIGGSHDTILMLFQNIRDTELCNEQLQISKKKDASNEFKGKRALEHIPISQKLVPRTMHFVRGKITDSFKVNPDPDLSYLEKESANQFLLWSLSRYSNNINMPIHLTCDKPNIPSSTATKSALFASPKNCSKTRIAFTQIIPYPATDFDKIYTCMIHFHDVILQKSLDPGPIWCDEGVYRIAKEFQLLNPEKV